MPLTSGATAALCFHDISRSPQSVQPRKKKRHKQHTPTESSPLLLALHGGFQHFLHDEVRPQLTRPCKIAKMFPFYLPVLLKMPSCTYLCAYVRADVPLFVCVYEYIYIDISIYLSLSLCANKSTHMFCVYFE